MTAPSSRRRRPRSTPPLVPPPPPLAPRNRAHIGADTVRAGYEAHKGHEHHGRLGRGCRTCRNYLAGIATAAERDAAQISATDATGPTTS
jgi:hypothetical protein